MFATGEHKPITEPMRSLRALSRLRRRTFCWLQKWILSSTEFAGKAMLPGLIVYGRYYNRAQAACTVSSQVSTLHTAAWRATLYRFYTGCVCLIRRKHTIHMYMRPGTSIQVSISRTYSVK